MVNGIDILYGSVCGMTHRNVGKPNQDSLNIKFSESGLTVAVADGHGSNLSFRSQIGSKLAVKAATETASSIVATGLRGKEFLQKWQKQIVTIWASEVLAHLKSFPFKPSELVDLSKKHSDALASNALLAYGSTIAAACLIDDTFYLVNLGDSDILVKTPNGIINVKLVDKNMVGGMTYSLATLGCLKKFAAEIINKTDVSSMLLATDGYQNSFASFKDFEKVLIDTEEIYKNNPYFNIHKEFNNWLKDTSDFGSGDDITAIILLAKEFFDN